jgi:hypothetical protein
LGRIALINLHVKLIELAWLTSRVVVIWMSDFEGSQVPLFFKLCSDHLSIEAIPRKPLTIDLKRMKDGQLHEHELMMWTPHFVVLKNRSGEEITLRRDGRMVIRKAASEQVARDAATGVISLVMKDFRG